MDPIYPNILINIKIIKIFKKKEILTDYRLYFAVIEASSSSASLGGDVRRLIKTVRKKEIKKAGTSS